MEDKRRWIFLPVLLVVIILAHLLMLRLVVTGSSEAVASESGSAETVQPPAEKTAAEKVPEGTDRTAGEKSAAAEDEEGGFWNWISGLFSGDEETSAAEVKKTGANAVKPPAPVWRYRQPSRSPLAGKPLDFSTARRGNLPETLVPGSNFAATGILVDLDTRRVLWEKNSMKAVPVASMVKIMTMLLVMEELERSRTLTPESVVTVGKAVMKVPRTGILWLEPGEKFTVRELLLGTAVKSANDAATQLAETVAGSVPKFVQRMKNRAASLGLRSMVFRNPCGLPDEKRRSSYSSAHDMVLLGERLLEYPLIMELSSIQQGSIRSGERKTIFVNTNKLINPRYPGVDGLKTGFTRASGFCLTFSAKRDGRRLAGCVTGFKSARNRDRFCRKLIDWGYSQR